MANVFSCIKSWLISQLPFTYYILFNGWKVTTDCFNNSPQTSEGSYVEFSEKWSVGFHRFGIMNKLTHNKTNKTPFVHLIFKKVKKDLLAFFLLTQTLSFLSMGWSKCDKYFVFYWLHDLLRGGGKNTWPSMFDAFWSFKLITFCFCTHWLCIHTHICKNKNEKEVDGKAVC